MGEIDIDDCVVKQTFDADGMKIIKIITPATVDTADTIPVTLSNYGIKTFEDIRGVVQTTANSVIAAEAPTTSVTAGVLTITVGGSTASNYKRVYTVSGLC